MNFSESASNKLMTTYPDLGKLVLSFRDMKGELDSESSIDMGVFIVRSGGRYFYIPVISRSGTIYPIDTMFDAEDRKFLPLTRNTVDTILNVQKLDLGRKIKIPKTVNKNPSVRELVEPPRTGKFVYASSGRLPEFLESTPPEMKAYLLEKIAEDVDLANTLNKMYGLRNILEPLQKKASDTPIVPATTSGINIITGGRGLPDEQIQDILNKGYSINGTPKHSRVAIASSPSSYTNEFTCIGAAEEGRAYEVIFKNGSTRQAICPPRADTLQLERRSDSNYIMFNDGSYCNCDKAVISNRELNYRDIMKDILEYKGSDSILNIEENSKVAIFDGSCLIGIFYISQVTSSDSGLCIRARSDTRSSPRVLRVFSKYEGKSRIESEEYHLNPKCIVIPVSTRRIPDELETNINAACTRREYESARLLEATMTIGHDNGTYSSDGKVVGSKPDMVRHLVVRKKILPNAAEDFMKKAEESGSVKILMSKTASYGSGTVPAEMPEYGEKADPNLTISGTAEQRAMGKSMTSLRQATKTGDKQVVDATLISELLQDPSLHDTISSYLPEIKEAMDKIGRIILLSRMKADDLSKTLDSEGLTDLLTSLRNTYKTLGDNHLKLERLSNNAVTDS